MEFVACYIRVSTAGTTQTMQRRELNGWLKSNRFNAKTVRWYIDKSATLLQRPKFDQLQTDILDGKVRAVVVSHLDRLATTPREGLNALIDWCGESLRVISVSQQIDIKSKDSTMIGTVLRGVLEMDEQTRGERTRAGLAAAIASGVVVGRPRGVADEAAVRKAKTLQEEGTLTVDQICKKVKMSRSTYYRHVAG
jgi:DNA invertase Pin-like site-specific DNA recombinase